MNKLEIFEFEDKEIRTQVDANGNPLFCVKDICNLLLISNSREATKNLKTKETVKIKTPPSGLGGSQCMTFTTESGLYKLIMQSRKREAQLAKDWICEELLPNLRKTGFFVNKLIDISKTTLKIEQSTYLMYNRTNNLTKIGRSYNVFEREKQLNSIFQHNEIFLIGYLKNRDIELMLHHNYSMFRVFGEWFNLEDCLIEELMLDNNFIIL